MNKKNIFHVYYKYYYFIILLTKIPFYFYDNSLQ